MAATNQTYYGERELVEKVLAGNTEAFGLIIKNTERLVTQIVFKMIADNEDRKDLAQDIYLKAYQKLSSFHFGSKLSTWIAQISYNTCLDYLRKKKLVLFDDFYATNEDSDELPDSIHSELPKLSIDQFLINKDLSAILKQEIEALPILYKTLITLFHNEELSYEEIGDITGLPSGTVKSYLFRARKALRNNLLLQYKKEDL